MASPLFSLQGLATSLFFAGTIYQEMKYRKERGLSGTAPASATTQYRTNETVEKVLNDIRKRVRTTSRKVTKRSVSSAEDRVFYVRKMIRIYKTDPDVRRLTAAILSRRCGRSWCIKEKDWANEVRAIFKFVRDQVRYTRDPDGVDTYQSPLVALESGAADCDCYVILLGSMLQSVGYPIQCRIIQLNGASTYGHIYLLVGMPPTKPTGWVPLDTSVDEPPGFQAPPYMVSKWKDFPV
jgi:transglutaminase-like putative cysteine protease